MYQRKQLADDSNIGEPGPLPDDLVGLTDESLADLSAALGPKACEELGYTGQGFVWIDDAEEKAAQEAAIDARIQEEAVKVSAKGLFTAEERDTLAKAIAILQAKGAVK